KDSIERHNGTNFFCKASNCAAASSAERPSGRPTRVGSRVIGNQRSVILQARQWRQEKFREGYYSLAHPTDRSLSPPHNPPTDGVFDPRFADSPVTSSSPL